MKKSINIWSFHGSWSLKDKMLQAKEAGFEGIELELSETGDLNPKSSDHEVKAVKALASEIGVQLSGLATGLYWAYNPVSQDEEIREQAFQILAKQIQTAALLNIDSILVVPGAVGADFIPNATPIPYDTAWKRASDFIYRAIPIAKSCGVNLCIENVWNKFLLSPLELRQFIDQFDTPTVGSYFDVANVLATGYPEHWPAILGNRIKRVHVKDYRRAIGTVDGFVDILSGDVNWPEVMRALRAINYDSWIAAEMIPPVPFYKYGPEILIQNTSKAMDYLLALS